MNDTFEGESFDFATQTLHESSDRSVLRRHLLDPGNVCASWKHLWHKKTIRVHLSTNKRYLVFGPFAKTWSNIDRRLVDRATGSVFRFIDQSQRWISQNCEKRVGDDVISFSQTRKVGPSPISIIFRLINDTGVYLSIGDELILFWTFRKNGKIDRWLVDRHNRVRCYSGLWWTKLLKIVKNSKSQPADELDY